MHVACTPKMEQRDFDELVEGRGAVAVVLRRRLRPLGGGGAEPRVDGCDQGQHRASSQMSAVAWAFDDDDEQVKAAAALLISVAEAVCTGYLGSHRPMARAMQQAGRGLLPA